MIILMTVTLLNFFLIFLLEKYYCSQVIALPQIIGFIRRNFTLKDGEDLLLWMGKWELSRSTGMVISEIVLPQYKFYTELLMQVLNDTRLFGGRVRPILFELKKGMGRDLRFERQVLDDFISGLLQVAIITFITWSFQLMVRFSFNLPTFYVSDLLLMVVQVIGLMLYLTLYRRQKNKIVGIFSSSLMAIFSLSLMSGNGVSITSIVQNTKVGEVLADERDGSLGLWKNRLEALINDWRVHGGPIKEELQILTEELWFELDNALEKFKKHHTMLRFFILAVFYLGPYLLSLVALFQHLILK